MGRYPFMACVSLVMLLSMACTLSTPKTKKLNRSILGAELEFGRRAAEFDLWNEAIFRWEKVVLVDPDNSDAVNNLAVAYESVGNYDRARDLYQNALELDEDNSSIRQNYKRFLNFYKKHQRQINRERAKKERDELAAANETPDDEVDEGTDKEQDEGEHP